MIVKDKICMAGSKNRVNEDIFGYSLKYGLFWVIDGATGLTDNALISLDEYGSDAQWFSHFTNQTILKLIENKPPNNNLNKEEYIKNLLTQTVEILNEEFLKIKNCTPIDKYEEPCASISIIFAPENDNNICCASLGDCPIIIQNKDLKIQSLTGCEKLEELDKISSKHALPYLKKGINFTKMRQKIRKILFKHRNMMNSDKGYWILSLEKKAIEHIKFYNFKKQQIKDILIMSDGFYAIVDKYKKYSNNGLIDASITHGLQQIYKEIREIECSIDANGTKYPRLKQSDDVTAMLISI